MMHRNNWNIWMRWQPRINWNTDESPEMSWTLRKDKLARGERAGKTLDPRKRIWSTRKTWIESTGEEKRWRMSNKTRIHRLKSLRKESKDFTRVGWILDYGPRFREEGWADGNKKTTEDWTQSWRGSSQLDEKCTGWKELRNNDRKTNCVILKKNLKGKRSNSKHLRQDSSPERRRGWGVKRIPTLRYN